MGLDKVHLQRRGLARVMSVPRLVLLICGFAIAATRIGAADSTPRLELTVSGEVTVTMDDALELEVRVVNATQQDLWFFGDLRWGHRAGLVLNVGPWDREGPLPLFLDHAEFTREELRDPRSFVRLRPRALIGQQRRIKVSDLVRKPGEYRLWVEYDAPLPAAAFDRPFWSAERGTLMSRAVLLHVVRTSKQKE
jgi:hypothetical protein